MIWDQCRGGRDVNDREALLREALKECSDDLAELVKSQYPTPIHPSQQRRYDRDMEPVVRARALLSQE
jgi:hypothetical protein